MDGEGGGSGNLSDLFAPARVSFAAAEALSTVNVDRLYGEISLDGSAVTRITVNGESPYTESGTVDASRTGITSLDDISGEMLSLSIDGNTHIKEFRIEQAGNGQPYYHLESFSADESALESIFVASGTHLRSLSASNLIDGLDGRLTETGAKGGGENGYAFVIMPNGGGLEELDLSSAGLYGKKWRLGTFSFIPNRPEEPLDNFNPTSVIPGAESNTSRLKSHPLFTPIITSVDVTNIHQYQAQGEDSEGNTTYYWVWTNTLKKTTHPNMTGSKVDWMNDWGLALKNLRMYGNMIGFRLFLGDLNMSIRDAINTGVRVSLKSTEIVKK